MAAPCNLKTHSTFYDSGDTQNSQLGANAFEKRDRYCHCNQSQSAVRTGKLVWFRTHLFRPFSEDWNRRSIGILFGRIVSLTIEHRGKAIRRLWFVRELAGSRRSVSRSNLLSSEVSASYQKETKWLAIEAHPAYWRLTVNRWNWKYMF